MSEVTGIVIKMTKIESVQLKNWNVDVNLKGMGMEDLGMLIAKLELVKNVILTEYTTKMNAVNK